MSIRKRTWTTGKGQCREAWIVDYVDQHGGRHIKTFDKKKEADAFQVGMRTEVRDGTHSAPSKSPTVAEAGELWLATAARNRLEASTVAQYRQHLQLHIVPYLGRRKLAELNSPDIREFEDAIRLGKPVPGEREGTARSAVMAKKVVGSLGSILADSLERGLVARNVVRDLKSRRRRGTERRAERRQRGKLRVGVDIPTPAEIRTLIDAMDVASRWYPLLLVAIFTGLRASEIRGLRWLDVDFKAAEIQVRQRADRYFAIGKPKSEAGERAVPVPPKALNVLREWKLRCPKGPLALVFPRKDGSVESYQNIIKQGLKRAQINAGVTKAAVDAKGAIMRKPDGAPVLLAKYAGLHALRHFYASWCINRQKDGGLQLPAKVVQERMGHSTIMMTLDTYGHLFPRGDDGGELAAAEGVLFGPRRDINAT